MYQSLYPTVILNVYVSASGIVLHQIYLLGLVNMCDEYVGPLHELLILIS